MFKTLCLIFPLLFAQIMGVGYRKVFTPAATGGPLPTANLAGWYKADSLSASPVTTWTDSSAAANNLTAVASPTWAASQINGLPAVTLNGTSQYFTGLSPANPNPAAISIYAIVKPASVTTNQALVGNIVGTGNFLYGLNPSGTQEADQQQQAVIGSSTTALTAGTWYEIAVTYDGSTVHFYRNGSADGSTAASYTFGTGPNALGAAYNGTSIVKFFDGEVAELVVYNTATYQPSVHSYFVGRYGI